MAKQYTSKTGDAYNQKLLRLPPELVKDIKFAALEDDMSEQDCYVAACELYLALRPKLRELKGKAAGSELTAAEIILEALDNRD